MFIFLTFATYEGVLDDLFFRMSIYSIAIFPAFGLLCALFGVKGYLRGILISIHILALLLFVFVLLLAKFGFQQP